MAKRTHQVLSTKDLLALEDNPNRWIVPDMIGKTNRILVFGEGGSYKSAIIFDLCVAVAGGSGLLKQTGGYSIATLARGPVLLNSTEGSLFDNKDRLLALCRYHGLNPTEMPLYFCQQPFCLDDQVDVQELELCIKEYKPVIVVLDPLDSFFSGDENSAKETKALRRAVDRLIDEYKCTFIVIHHQSKGDKLTPRGSSAWYGWADAVLHSKVYRKKLGLQDNEESEILEWNCLKQRNGRRFPGPIFSAVPVINAVTKETRFVYYNGKDTEKVALECWKDRIYEALLTSTTPMTNGMLGDALGTRPEKLIEALSILETEGKIAKDGLVPRQFGVDSSRTKGVAAWRPVVRLSVVDAAQIMVKAADKEAQQYTVEPQPPGTPLADPPDDRKLRLVGGGKGS